MDRVQHLIPTAVAVVVMIAIATVVLSVIGVRRPWSPLAAVARGALQLALISIVLSGVITDLTWVAVALAVMFVAATVTSTRRIGGGVRAWGVVAGGMAAGIAVTSGLVFGIGALESSARYLLALGGIIIGGAMSIATMAGRRLRHMTCDRWSEVEAWIALGATPRQSTADIARIAIGEALIPTTDQTKTTGLVTLPGAFVGAIFGGISPIEAGRFQLIVLAAIMTTGVITATVIALVLAPVRQKPLEPA